MSRDISCIPLGRGSGPVVARPPAPRKAGSSSSLVAFPVFAVLVLPVLGRWVGALGAGAEQAGHLGGELAGGPAPVVALGLGVDLPGPDVLDDSAPHLEALPRQPARRRRREVADHLAHVDRVSGVERLLLGAG